MTFEAAAYLKRHSGEDSKYFHTAAVATVVAQVVSLSHL